MNEEIKPKKQPSIQELAKAQRLLKTSELDVLLKIYEKLCAIHEQLKTEVVTRDKFR